MHTIAANLQKENAQWNNSIMSLPPYTPLPPPAPAPATKCENVNIGARGSVWWCIRYYQTADVLLWCNWWVTNIY